MTDRIHALTVVLTQDYRDDDVQSVVSAIKMIKGVLDVNVHVADMTDYSARTRAVFAIRTKITQALHKIFDDVRLD